MLRKCLKYDFKETFKLWWVGALTCLIASIPMGIVMDVMSNNQDPSVSDGSLLIIPLFLLSWLGMMIGMILSQVVVYVRYYRHFFGKESYLTFTLPVKRSTLFTSKFITALFFTVISYVQLFGSLFIMLFITSDGMGVYEAFDSGISTGLESLIPGAAVIAVIVLIYGVFIIAIATLNILSYFLVITFCGVYFNKYSLLAIIVAFYLLGNFGTLIIALPLMCGAVYASSLIGLGTLGVLSIDIAKTVLLVILVPALTGVLFTTVNVLLAFLNLELLERKLNVN